MIYDFSLNISLDFFSNKINKIGNFFQYYRNLLSIYIYTYE